ncbi:MAG: dihydroorotate dehydrogenase electron transfer subunit [Bacteroidaceae bacterium]|nr:dihydroorotate dehydrogenase electron transfer subunit [Bacteroidaceae bacterium]
MKKYILDLKVRETVAVGRQFVLLRLTADDQLPEMVPGQFVEVRIDETPSVLLRRPISIHYYDKAANELGLLVQLVGNGTRWMATLEPGDTVNIVLPLGNGFTLPADTSVRPLLIGGGVGVAPLLYLGQKLKEMGITPTFLLGSRTENELMRIAEYEKVGPVYITTENGAVGEQGYVTQHSVLTREQFDQVYTCGPKPMMVAVARWAKAAGVACEVSLENKMACGVGACLCCVEDTKQGHVCVCSEGPVFSIDKLSWQI